MHFNSIQLYPKMPATRHQLQQVQRTYPFFADAFAPTYAELLLLMTANLEFKWCSHLETDVCCVSICPNFARCGLCQMILLCRCSDEIYEPDFVIYAGVLHNLSDVYDEARHRLENNQMRYPHYRYRIQ